MIASAKSIPPWLCAARLPARSQLSMRLPDYWCNREIPGALLGANVSVKWMLANVPESDNASFQLDNLSP